VAQQFFPKPFNATQLKTGIERSLALRRLLSDKKLVECLSQIRSLPSLPALYVSLMNELRRPEANIDSIGNIITQDMAMTAKLLQMANQGWLAQPVSSAAEAVMYLGVETVKALVLSAHIFSQFNQPYHFLQAYFSVDRLWQHAWSTAKRAREIAREEGADQRFADHCLCAGLLHDIGKLILATNFPNEFLESQVLARKKNITSWEADYEVLGVSHAEIGAYLLGLWNLPDAVIEAVAFHHQPAASGCREFLPLTAVHVANALDYLQHNAAEGLPDKALDRKYLKDIGAYTQLQHWWIVSQR
jgi:putative nucleotidyltransferase with HDIG domain